MGNRVHVVINMAAQGIMINIRGTCMYVSTESIIVSLSLRPSLFDPLEKMEESEGRPTTSYHVINIKRRRGGYHSRFTLRQHGNAESHPEGQPYRFVTW